MTEEKQEPSFAEARGGKEKLNIEDLKKKLEGCQKLKDEYLAGWQRARAELLNYKKEELDRLGEILKYADVGLILKILPILDNFEIAEREIQNMKCEEKKYKEAIKGILQIKNQIQDFLKGQRIEEIKSLGEKFDPNLMEIVEIIEVKNKESGIVIEEIQKGYKLHDKILRPARVKVSK